MFFTNTIYRKDNLIIDGKINYRKAARGVCINGKKILMLYSQFYDHYEFPGGGFKDTETGIEAVKREFEEETGYIVSKVNDQIGQVIEYDISKTKEFDIYNVVNSYYLVEIGNERGKQKLEEDEIIFDYIPVWVDPKIVIDHYKQLIDKKDIVGKEWVKREKYVLEEIVAYLMSE